LFAMKETLYIYDMMGTTSGRLEFTQCSVLLCSHLEGSYCLYVITIYLRMLAFNTISIFHDVRVG
jgi:hypothetical protein